MTQLRFEAIGTSWTIDIPQTVSDEQRAALLAAVMARIDEFDRAYSRFRDDSLVSEMSRRAGTFVLPDDAAPMIGAYRKLYDLTDGRMTPLIGQVMVDAGYDAHYSLKPKPLSRPPRWDDAMRFDAPNLTLHVPALLDFGAAGKGYLIDIVGKVLESNGITAYTIDAGQDILFRAAPGEPRLRVGLENPANLQQVVGVVELAGGSICGSAGSRRAWADYHHIIDPATLMSPRHVLATWVIAESALLADALASALFFVSPQRLAPLFAFEYCVLDRDMGATQSRGFGAELFTK